MVKCYNNNVLRREHQNTDEQTKENVKMKMVLVASVMGENENYFAIVNADSFHHRHLGKIVKKFKESASKYFLVDKQYCDVMISYGQSVTVAAVIESNNRADGYFKDMDKKCFEFLVDAVKTVEAEQFNKDLVNMIGELADMI